MASENLEGRGLHQVFNTYALESGCEALLSMHQRGYYYGAQQPRKFFAWFLHLNSLDRLK
jgi:hypothetical protein